MLERQTNPYDQLDIESYLARQLHTIATSTLGTIVLGGLITSIAKHLGHGEFLAQLTPIEGACTIDLTTLTAMHRIAFDEDDYYLVFSATSAHHLLSNLAYSLRNPDTWKFPLMGSDDDFEEEVPASPPPPTHDVVTEVDNVQILVAIQSMDAHLQAMDN
ncbi:hypothetical protein E2542_SST03550 [Spatholobus suberectus]|nr:hypothetical protein E2542_SST03550 [Spatholobus suberectus]